MAALCSYVLIDTLATDLWTVTLNAASRELDGWSLGYFPYLLYHI